MNQLMKFAICDDEIAQLELLTKLVREWCILINEPCKIRTFQSAESFMFSYEDDSDYDLLLLDIQMKEMNGMELANKLRARKEEVQILFITGISDYVFAGYAVNAVSYLMKPVQEKALHECLLRVYDRIHKEVPYLLCEDKGETRKIRISDICYVESAGHNTYLHVGEMEYRSKVGIQELSKQLEACGFYRLHRSYLVSIAKLESIGKSEVVLEGGCKIPIARGKWEGIDIKKYDYQAYLSLFGVVFQDFAMFAFPADGYNSYANKDVS